MAFVSPFVVVSFWITVTLTLSGVAIVLSLRKVITRTERLMNCFRGLDESGNYILALLFSSKLALAHQNNDLFQQLVHLSWCLLLILELFVYLKEGFSLLFASRNFFKVPLMEIFFFYFYWLSFFGFGCSLRWLELLRTKLFFRVTHNRIVFQDFVLNLIILVVGFFIAHWSLPAGFSFFKSCILLLGRRIWDEIVTSCRCKSWISLGYGHLSLNLVRYERGAGRRERGDRVDIRE